ncbi:lysozyme [Mucilaginibacter ginkgonis]|uniref:Lysozyme n=1 Tax=Mucilaginibacter ginkgonis TaxID=2682091 RepID=A0A6I4HVY6_9SPHI|nr:lysozyme [Mucilaginibacter ginkgonis]QQL51086.1 lysozyme [Mucilaginibacter ginkgonis]
MKTSQSAINKLKATEQFRATAYKDGYTGGVQNYSIGYGHQIGLNEQNLKTATITTSQAETLMRNDLAPLEGQLNKAKYPFNQNQFDALVSFGYNTGSGSLAKVIDTWNTTHSTSKVTAQMALYTKTHDNKTGELVASSALEKRRAAEVTLFNNPSVPVIAIAAIAFATSLYLFS